MRKRGKVDANQSEIVQAIRGIGAAVHITSNLGDGFPDIVVSFMGKWDVIEIKDGSRPPSEQLLTDGEVRFIRKQRAPVYIVNSAEQAVALLTNRTARKRMHNYWFDFYHNYPFKKDDKLNPYRCKNDKQEISPSEDRRPPTPQHRRA